MTSKQRLASTQSRRRTRRERENSPPQRPKNRLMLAGPAVRERLRSVLLTLMGSS